MPEVFTVTGLMSGSSLDGVDLACCEFTRATGKWDFQILAAETISYPALLEEQLGLAVSWDREKLLELDLHLGKYYAGLINEFHAKHNVFPDLVASHGHTILHNPARGITFQAGHGEIMATQTGITVINDFRSEDVARGGQGAPLVPIGDRLLFGGFDACLNLGGFANISFENQNQQRIAYDIGPANMVLNWIAGIHGQPFDDGGIIASKGKVDQELLGRLNGLEFYSMEPPKSLGKEWFMEAFLPEIRHSDLDIPDLMATAVEHEAIQISAAVKDSKANTVLVTGGGAMNKTLVERLRYHTTAKIQIPDLLLIRFKEALVFALLGLLRKLGEVNCLASVTGGKTDLSSGTIHNP